jgi:CRISPR system Cascade subunit CasE
MKLYSVHLRPARLLQYAASQGLAKASDEDLGYACHAWLKAMFGALAPKPFRLLDARPGQPARILAYGTAHADAMLEHAAQFADPIAYSAMDEDSLAEKTMPDRWRDGLRLGFETLICPTTRKDGVEKDAFLRQADTEPDKRHERAMVYHAWLKRQLEPATTLQSLNLDGFTRVNLTRRAAAPGGGRRLVTIERPRALVSGVIVVRDPAEFAVLLARGVGRHRAFGFGMLLLKPA